MNKNVKNIGTIQGNNEGNFRLEYIQLKMRCESLQKFLSDWDEGNLTFVPKSRRAVYDIQLEAMKKYLSCLETRSVNEGVDLPV